MREPLGPFPTSADPINRIEWRDAATLEISNWNPNHVFMPEMRLLERNLILHGWIQPLLISRDGVLIDGYHRLVLATRSERLVARYNRLVPCVVMDVDRAEAMMLTVRMNRAKGTHVAVRMSHLVQRLIDDEGAEIDEIAVNIGATVDEVRLLYKGGVFKNRNIEGWQYSKAWVPMESASAPPEDIEFEREADETDANLLG